jgi:hypothetical protein
MDKSANGWSVMIRLFRRGCEPEHEAGHITPLIVNDHITKPAKQFP